MDFKHVSPHFRGIAKKVKPAADKAEALQGSYGGFVRMSHTYSVERGSIENHRMEIERFAQVRGLALSTWYILPAISGKTIWHHPEVVRMRADIESGRIRGIVFTKLARICRNLKELLEFRDFFAAHDAHMVCPEFNTADVSGRFLYNLLGSLAEMEREAIAERVTASVRPRAERGMALGGAPKYGFRWVRQTGATTPWRLERCPEEITIIRALLALFFEEQSFKTTARRLSKLAKTRRGFEWSDSRVIGILTDPIYRGTWIRNRTTFKDGTVREKDRAEWVGLTVEPVYSPAEIARIDSIISRIQVAGTRPTNRQRYLLTQITCGECEGKVYVHKRRDGEAFYKCQRCMNQVAVAEMDALILGELENIHENEEQISRLSEQLQANLLRRAALVEEAQSMRAAERVIDTRLGELARIAIDLGAQGVKAESRRLQDEAQALAAKAAELQEEAGGYIEIEDVTTFLDRVRQVPTAIRSLPDGKARYQLLAALIPTITLTRESIHYELNFLRGLPDFGVKQQQTLTDSSRRRAWNDRDTKSTAPPGKS